MAKKTVVKIADVKPDEHIASCGLFCSNCGAFKKQKCQGCMVSPMYASCPIRKCAIEKGIITCAECSDFKSPRSYKECKKMNNFISKIFGLVFKSDRPGGLATLRDKGKEAYLAEKRKTGKM